MDDLAYQCDELASRLRSGDLHHARAWLVGALDMVDAAIAVENERVNDLKQTLRHLTTTKVSDESFARRVDRVMNGEVEPADDASAASDTASEASDSDAERDATAAPAADGDATAQPPAANALPDDDDVPIAALAAAPQPTEEEQPAVANGATAKRRQRKAKVAAPRPARSLGELGALVLAATAVSLGRNEDSIPFSAIPETVEAAKSAMEAAEREAKEAAAAAAACEAAALAAERQREADADKATPAKGEDKDSAAAGSGNASQTVSKQTPNDATSKPKGSGSTGKRSLAAAAAGTRSLFSFGVKKEATPQVKLAPGEEDFFTPFAAVDRKPSDVGALWHAKPEGGATAAEGKSLLAMLNKNEIDVRGMGVPRGFNPEVVFCMWAHENFITCELRPPFLGTCNPSHDKIRLGRPAGPEVGQDGFAVPRVAAIDYDDDSGDDWDSDGEGSSIGALSDRSEESELDSDDREFVVGDDETDDEEMSDGQREESAMERSEIAEAKARQRRKVVDLEPRFEGVFDGLPLSRHPLGRDDRLVFANPMAASAINEGREFLRVARDVFERAGITIPDELLTEAEKTAIEAKKIKEAKAAARAAAGVTVKRAAKKPKAPAAAGTNPLAAAVQRAANGVNGSAATATDAAAEAPQPKRSRSPAAADAAPVPAQPPAEPAPETGDVEPLPQGALVE